jgi:hypothetical protein
MDDLEHRIKLALLEIDNAIKSLNEAKVDSVIISNVRRAKKAIEGIVFEEKSEKPDS